MPITFNPSKQPLSTVDLSRRATDAKDLLEKSCENVSGKCVEIFQSSFTASAAAAAVASPNVSSSGRFAATDLSKSTICAVSDGNGLVNTAVEAYNHHHHLIIRPDDVWIAILAQFNLYVNANAEALRHVFVDHEGQKKLQITSVGTRYDVHFGKLAEQMGVLIQENVKDPELREWIIPKFSTTTENDVIVSSIVMMATLKAYFSYSISLMCGLPGVTLLGEKSDWEGLSVKAEKLASYGEQTTKWYSLLKPVLTAFVRSFDEPDSDRTMDFWQSIAHHSGGGSGPSYLSGWITAFCFFNKEGVPLYSEHTIGKEVSWDGLELGSLNWDGVEYHRVDTENIPPAYAEVDVKLDDNGKEIGAVMVAGLVGMEVSSSYEGKDDTVQPVAGWWLFEEGKTKV